MGLPKYMLGLNLSRFRKHRTVVWQGITLLTRCNSVDQENLNWLSGSEFVKCFYTADIKPGEVVIDLGAHIGSFAILAAKSRGCRTFAFEPDEQSFKLCRSNATRNRANVRCLNYAVGGKTEMLDLYEAIENWGHTTLRNGGPHNALTGRKTQIRCLSLRDALDLCGGKCAFLKFNIEGSEFDMIEQSEPEILRRVNFMIGEVHYDLVPRTPDAMITNLHAAGFKTLLAPIGERRDCLTCWR